MKRFSQLLCMLFSCTFLFINADTTDTWCTITHTYTVNLGEDQHSKYTLKASYNPDKATEEESGFVALLTLGGKKVYRWKPSPELFSSWQELGNLDPFMALLMGGMTNVEECETCLEEDFEHPLLETVRDICRQSVPDFSREVVTAITSEDDPVREPLFLGTIGDTLEACEIDADTSFDPEPVIKTKTEYAPFTCQFDGELETDAPMGKILLEHQALGSTFDLIAEVTIPEEMHESLSEVTITRKEGINISQASASGHRIRYAIGYLTEYTCETEEASCKILVSEVTKIKRKPPVINGLHTAIPKQESLEGLFKS